MSSVRNPLKPKDKKKRQEKNRMRVEPFSSLLTCPKCSHVHYPVSRKEAERQVKVFNNYFNSLTLEERHRFYNNTPSSMSLYETCFMCQEVNYKEFKKLALNPNGTIQTTQPILDPNE